MSHTPSEVDMLLRLWPIFVGVIMLVAWLIRLEAKSLHTEEKLNAHINNAKKELDDHKKSVKDNEGKVWDKIDTIKDQNTEILRSISRLEGKLERKGVSNETVL